MQNSTSIKGRKRMSGTTPPRLLVWLLVAMPAAAVVVACGVR